MLEDLIETLWNVKRTINADKIIAGSRFNRDIVECKVKGTPKGLGRNARI